MVKAFRIRTGTAVNLMAVEIVLDQVMMLGKIRIAVIR